MTSTRRRSSRRAASRSVALLIELDTGFIALEVKTASRVSDARELTGSMLAAPAAWALGPGD